MKTQHKHKAYEVHPAEYDEKGRKIKYGRVDCGCGNTVVLMASANDCEHCEAVYNLFGQKLAPRRLWEEE